MRVLITGAGGFIGSHLVKDQLARGRAVVALDLKEGLLNVLPSRPAFQFIRGDVTDADVLKRALAGVDIVFHLASMHLEVGVSAERFEAVNVRAVHVLLAAAREAGVKRFVHCSSVGIYGHVRKPPADEAGPFEPSNLYETTKLAGEREALRFHRDTGFPVAVVRPAWVFGPGCPRTAKLLRSIGQGRFPMIGPCRNFRHPVYIKDMVDAFNLAADRPEAVGEAFVIGAERPVRLDEFVRTFAEATGHRPPWLHIPLWLGYALALLSEVLFRPLGPQPPFSRRTLVFYTNNNAFDISKAKRRLGFSPRFDLRSGLADTLASRHPVVSTRAVRFNRHDERKVTNSLLVRR